MTLIITASYVDDACVFVITFLSFFFDFFIFHILIFFIYFLSNKILDTQHTPVSVGQTLAYSIPKTSALNLTKSLKQFRKESYNHLGNQAVFNLKLTSTQSVLDEVVFGVYMLCSFCADPLSILL